MNAESMRDITSVAQGNFDTMLGSKRTDEQKILFMLCKICACQNVFIENQEKMIENQEKILVALKGKSGDTSTHV